MRQAELVLERTTIMNIVFYCAPQSSASPVHAALVELGVPHERVELDLQKGDQLRAEYAALNPNRKVPLLVVDGQPLFEAVAIMMWLGERFGVERGLWPAADDPKRLEAWSWCVWAYVSYGSAMGRLIYATSPRLEPKLHHAPAAVQAQSDLQELLGLLEARLSRQGHMLGERYSLCDLVVASVVGYSVYVGADIGAFPRLGKWLQSCQQRDAFRAAA